MNKLFTTLFIVFINATCLFAQSTSGNVGVGTISPSLDAVLDISSNDRGMLIPRLNTIQMNNIFTLWAQCQPGLLIYNTTDNLFYYNSSIASNSAPTWVSFPTKQCPSSFTAIGKEYCVQSNASANPSVANWTDAMSNCKNFTDPVNGAINAHLCSFAEWNTACNANIFTIAGMTDGIGEWIDDATSATESILAGTTSGSGSSACAARIEEVTTLQRGFRCCYLR